MSEEFLIEDLNRSLIFFEGDGNEELSLIKNMKEVEIIKKLTSISAEIFKSFSKEDNLLLLKDRLEKDNVNRRLTPLNGQENISSLDDLYNYFYENYITERIIRQHKDWLTIIFRHRDYSTLEKILKKEELKEKDVIMLHENIEALPLSTFGLFWDIYGNVEDLIKICRYRFFHPYEKEDRVILAVSFNKSNMYANKELYRECLKNAPNAFYILTTKNPKLSLLVLDEKIDIPKNVTLPELKTIEKSIYDVLGDTASETASRFAFAFLEERITGDYTRQEREIAWKFALAYYEEDWNDAMKSWINDDNQLWVLSKIKKTR